MKCPVCNTAMSNGVCPSCGMRVKSGASQPVSYDKNIKSTGYYRRAEPERNEPEHRSFGDFLESIKKKANSKNKSDKSMVTVVIVIIIVLWMLISFFSNIVERRHFYEESESVEADVIDDEYFDEYDYEFFDDEEVEASSVDE